MEDNNRQAKASHGGVPEDDESIEIVSESGVTHITDWSIFSDGNNSIAGSDVGSMDFQKLSIRSQKRKFVHHDGRQFIECRDLNDGGLPYSAEFYLGDEMWKVSGEDCLLMSPRRYISKVTMEGPVKLDEAVAFEQAVQLLMKHLTLIKVLMDERLDECNKLGLILKKYLSQLASESGINDDFKRDTVLLHILMQRHGSALNQNFKQDLANFSTLSNKLMSALDNYVTKCLKLIERNELLGHLNESSLSDKFIVDAIQKASKTHRDRLLFICPSIMKNDIQKIPDDQILAISTDDIDLFNDLTSLDQAIFGSALPIIISKFVEQVQDLNGQQLGELKPLSDRIFFHICKSLLEVAQQFQENNKNDNVLYYSVQFGWRVTFPEENPLTRRRKCFRQQLKMLVKLANHFEPCGPFRTSCFLYNFQLFQNMDAVPEPVRVWLCILDNCMADLAPANTTKMQMFSCFFKSVVSCIASERFSSDTLECLRTITRDALQSFVDLEPSPEDRSQSGGSFTDFFFGFTK